jgi:hypothetical protein
MSEEITGGCNECDSYECCNDRFVNHKLVYDRVCKDGNDRMLEIWWDENGIRKSDEEKTKMGCFKPTKGRELLQQMHETLDDLKKLYPHRIKMYDKEKDS